MRVTVCDDHGILLEALESALRGAGHDVVATSRTPKDAIAAVQLHRPDACLIDLVFPGDSGLEAIGPIVSASPETKVIVMTGMRSRTVIRQALDAGAFGVISKTQSLSEILRVLKGCQQDRPTSRISRIPAQRSWVDRITPGNPGWALRFLTDREWQVMDCLAEGASTEAIAAKLGVRHGTARGYVQNLLDKLSVHSRLQAVALLDTYRRVELGSAPRG